MMKRIAVAIFLFTGLSLFAGNPAKFSLSAGPTLDSYGYISDEGKIYGTEYSGFRIEPDWCFANNWGLRCSLGSAWAFTTNASDVWERPMFSIWNADLAVIPYYEFRAGEWFFDLGAVVGGRFRMPFMNTEPSKYLMTVSASAGADLRAGYNFSEKWSCFVQAEARRTLYDYLYTSYYTTKLPVSGCIITVLGISYSF